MYKISIIGGNKLSGNIAISGAKNASLPLMASSLLTEEDLILGNIPQLNDVRDMGKLLANMGVDLKFNSKELILNAKNITSYKADYDLVRKMRASVLVLGPLLARRGSAQVSLPGGCSIGTRPIDLHLDILNKMGANIELKDGYINASVGKKGIHGCKYHFPQISVGATENALMAASLANGTTLLTNTAREPEVTDLSRCLVKMGAKIDGIGSDSIEIEGVSELRGAYHKVIFDRIEAGTFAVAAAITGGKVFLEGIKPDIMQSILTTLTVAGVKIEIEEEGFWVIGDSQINSFDITTKAFPGFPTDMQAQMVALASLANNSSLITETIFENRFMHVPELLRMGANIKTSGNSALIRGVKYLTGAQVMATDLRASVSLILAGLVAKGETKVGRIYHLDRGYEKLEKKLRNCGANIKRIKEDL